MKVRMTSDMINRFNRDLKDIGSVVRVRQVIDRNSVEIVLRTDILLNTRYSSIVPNDRFYNLLESFVKNNNR